MVIKNAEEFRGHQIGTVFILNRTSLCQRFVTKSSHLRNFSFHPLYSYLTTARHISTIENVAYHPSLLTFFESFSAHIAPTVVSHCQAQETLDNIPMSCQCCTNVCDAGPALQ